MWAPGGDDLAAPETRERKRGASAAGHRGSAPSLRKARDLPTPAWGPRGSGSQREAGRRAENVRVVSESVERDGKHSRTQRSAPFSSPRHRAAHPSPSASSGVYLCQFPPPFGRFLHRVPGDRVCGARAGEDVPTRRGGESPLPRTPSFPFSVPGFRQHAFNYYVAVAHWTDRFRAAVGTEVFSAPWLGPLIPRPSAEGTRALISPPRAAGSAAEQGSWWARRSGRRRAPLPRPAQQPGSSGAHPAALKPTPPTPPPQRPPLRSARKCVDSLPADLRAASSGPISRSHQGSSPKQFQKKFIACSLLRVFACPIRA